METNSDFGVGIIRIIEPILPPAIILNFGYESVEDAVEKINSSTPVLGHDELFTLTPGCDCGRCYENQRGDAQMVVGRPLELIGGLLTKLHIMGMIIYGNEVIKQAQDDFFHGPTNN